MSSPSGSSTHFLALRRRLDILGYDDLPLGLDSAPLVSRMMEDIVADTEALRRSEEELHKSNEKLSSLEEQIEPLQAEISTVKRENTQLHQQLVSSIEESLKTGNQNSVTIFELKTENRRLKLLNQKASQHVTELNKEIDRLKKGLADSLAAPAMMKVPETIETVPRLLRGRGSRTASSSQAGSVASSVESGVSTPAISFDPNLFNTELDNLRKERDDAVSEAKKAMANLNELQDVLKVRDNEIKRLGEDLQKETGMNGYLITLKQKCQQQTLEIDKLKAQFRAIGSSGKKTGRQKRLARTPVVITVSIEDDRVQEEEIIIREEERAIESSNQSNNEEETEMESSSVTNVSENEDAVEEINAQRVENAAVGDSLSRSTSKDQEKLWRKIKWLEEQLQERDNVIASMCADFAFIYDNLGSVLNEKDNVISALRSHLEDSDEIVIDSEEIDRLQRKLTDMKMANEIALKEKDARIEELENNLQTTQHQTVEIPAEHAELPKECLECQVLKEKLATALQNHDAKTSELESLKGKYKQLETLVVESDKDQRDNERLAQELQQTRNELTACNSELNRMRSLSQKTDSSIEELQKQLREAQQELQEKRVDKSSQLIEQLTRDRQEMSSELKAKTTSMRSLSQQLLAAQNTIQGLKTQMDKLQEEADGLREDATFHRAKGEEISRKSTDRINQLIRESSHNVQSLQKQLDEKSRENTHYQQLLSETRRQLAPLTETVIPKYKTQIMRMQSERDELVRRVKRLAQFAVYVEQAVTLNPDCPDAQAFRNALHQLQEELKFFE